LVFGTRVLVVWNSSFVQAKVCKVNLVFWISALELDHLVSNLSLESLMNLNWGSSSIREVGLLYLAESLVVTDGVHDSLGDAIDILSRLAHVNVQGTLEH
jgi:hypothetical protein